MTLLDRIKSILGVGYVMAAALLGILLGRL
jgi:hypothetical protein